MKISSSIAVCSLAMFSVPFEMSAQSRVFVDPFLSAPAFQIAGGVNDLRVAESYRIAPPEESTHILIEGLVPIEVGSNVVVSNYTGINLNTGEVKDVGSLYFTMPPNAPAPDAASSPIVGIVARNGSWDGLTSAPPATPIGGSIGNIHIDMQASTLVFNIAGYTGTAHYSRIDNFTLQIDDFRLSNGGANLDFYGAQFSLYRGDLYGIVQTKNPLNENARLFELRINHLEDYDGDQIPDLLMRLPVPLARSSAATSLTGQSVGCGATQLNGPTPTSLTGGSILLLIPGCGLTAKDGFGLVGIFRITALSGFGMMPVRNTS